ncbi:MAG: hypothetical protein ACK4HW_03835 [Roseinatronobacter sp.]
MQFYLDVFIAFAAILAAAYCMLLSRRLRTLTRLDGDIGAAIAVMSQQVDALTKALSQASNSTTKAEASLALTIARAETTARNLELLLAANRTGPAVAQPPMDSRPTDEFSAFGRAPTRSRVLRTRDPERGTGE